MKQESFVELYCAASEDQIMALRAINDAHSIATSAYQNNWDWRMFLPIPFNKWWAADRRLFRVCAYLYARRVEVLGGRNEP